MTTVNSNHNISLYEHAGGWDALYRLSDIFYHLCLVDPILQPLFGHEQPGHVENLQPLLLRLLVDQIDLPKRWAGLNI